MSRSTTSTINLERERLDAAIRAAVSEATSNQLRSLALPQPRTVADAAHVLDGLQARTTAVATEVGVANALATNVPTVLETCSELTQRSRDAMRRGEESVARDLALEGDRVLRQGLLDAAGAVARQERLAAGNLISGALERIGCTTTVFANAAKTGIWAERDHQMVAVLIDDDATTQIDIAGCDGGECTPLHHELETELARVGVRLRGVTEIDHGDRRGGTLIQRAAAVSDKSDMAEGIVKVTPSRFAARATPTAQPSHMEAC